MHAGTTTVASLGSRRCSMVRNALGGMLWDRGCAKFYIACTQVCFFRLSPLSRTIVMFLKRATSGT